MTESPQAMEATELRRSRLGRAQIKLLLRLAIAPFVAFFAISAVGFLSRTMADITRSEETAAIFNVSAKLHHDLVGAVDWRPDPPDLPKQLPPLEREAITETWLRAWAQFLILSDGFDPVGSSVDGEATDGIGEYFDAAAGEAMLAAHADWLGLPIHQIGHELQLNFYSDDGAVVSISSVGSRFLRGQPVDGEIEWYDTVETYDAVFVLQDGNWRIYNWVRRSSEGAWATDVDVDIRPLDLDEVRSLTWRPSGQTIERFWEEPDLNRAAAEIAVVDDLGFNTMRIELPFELLGGRDVELSELFPAAALLDIAEENGLRVIVSLLADRREHQPLHWDADDDHLRTVMETLGNHPALLLWEISAQPDTHLGVERVDRRMLDAWLTHIGRTVREADPDTPISIGWSTPRAAIEAPPIADVVAFSWTGDRVGVEADLDLLREVAGDRPIMLSDATYHTGADVIALPLPLPIPPLPAPGAQTEKEQARFFADMLLAVEELDLAGFNVASLRDFDVEEVAVFEQAEAERLHEEEKQALAAQEALFPPPATPEPKEAGPAHVEAPVIAEVTWPTGSAALTGLVRADGSPKPAAAVFAPGADLEAVPAPTLSESIRKPFNLLALGLLIGGLGCWAALWLWARNIIRLPAIRPVRFAWRILMGTPVLGPMVLRARAFVLRLPLIGPGLRLARRLLSLIPIPHIRRRPADGDGAQQRLRRTRKKVSVTAPIDHQPAAAAAAPASAPKVGMFRRVVDWLNAPVLPESSEESGPVETAESNGHGAANTVTSGVAANGSTPVSDPQMVVAESTAPPLTTAAASAAALEGDLATQQAQFATWLNDQQANGAAADQLAAQQLAAADLAAKQAAEQTATELAAQQAVAELAAEQAALQQRAAIEAARQQLAAEQLARQQAAAELAAEQVAAEQIARQRTAAELAAEQVAAEQLARQQAAAELAAEQMAAEIAAKESAERQAQAQAAADIAAKQAAERLAQEHAAAALAAQHAAEERAAQEAAEQLAQAQAAAQRTASEELAAKLAAERLAQEQVVAELAAQRAAEQPAQEHAAAEFADRQIATHAAADDLAKPWAIAERAAAARLAAEQRAAGEDAPPQPSASESATPVPSQPMRTPTALPSPDSHSVGPTTLADALPEWPTDDMHYDDVHDAMFGTRFKAPPPPTAMALIEVDLQSIDSVLESTKALQGVDGPLRYAPFLVRALCIVTRERSDGDGADMHIEVRGAEGSVRRIDRANEKRLTTVSRALAPDGSSDGGDGMTTVIVQVSTAAGNHLAVEIGDGDVPTVSLVHLNKRPITTRDHHGCMAITTHSMGLLSVAASSTPGRADEYLERLRDVLEQRDWRAEAD